MGSLVLLCLLFICSSPGYIFGDNLQFSIKPAAPDTQQDVLFLFAHGLGANQNQSTTILGLKDESKNNRWIMQKPIALFNFLDVNTGNKSEKTEYIRKRVCLGQEKDIACLHEAYSKVREQFPGYNIILVGISRGASTILNYLAEYSPERVKAVVLESPFDSLSSIIKHLLSRYCLSWVPFSKPVAYKICKKYFPSVDPKGIFPIKILHKIRQDLPIIIIHSKKDKVIPIMSSRNVYIKLKEAGNNHVYLAELVSGSHGKLFKGPDADLYFYIIHAFYKKYGIIYDEIAASRGNWFLANCQPDVHTLRKIKRTSEDSDEEDDYSMLEETEDFNEPLVL